jgi:hypothetical protein
VRPAPTATALRSAGIAVPLVLVRLLALVELVVACDTLVEVAVWSRLLLVASYLAFAAFIGFALVLDIPLASCGCFGEPDTPPTPAHLFVNLGLAAAVLVAMVQSAPSPGSVLVTSPGAGSLAAVGVIVATGCCILVLTSMARVTAEARSAKVAILGPDASRRSA